MTHDAGILCVAVRDPRNTEVLLKAVPIQTQSDVLMTQPSKDWNRGDAAYLLGTAKIRSIFF